MKRAGPIWRNAARLVVGVALFGATVGCAALSGERAVTYPPTARQVLLGDITVEARGEALIEGPPYERANCEVLSGSFRWSDTTLVRVVALPVGCEPESQESLNFDYQMYRPDSVDPSPAGMIGSPSQAALSNQVCTSECRYIPTVVGVLALNEPVVVGDVEYDVLNLYIDDSDNASNKMNDIVANLQR